MTDAQGKIKSLKEIEYTSFHEQFETGFNTLKFHLLYQNMEYIGELGSLCVVRTTGPSDLVYTMKLYDLLPS